MVACGTAYYACMVAKYWFEQLAGLPVDLDIGSEFRYRDPPLAPGSAALFVSQSGETADTLAAMRHVKSLGLATIGLVNVPESTLAREVACHLRTLAGPEIGVASTKAFTTQLAMLACLAIGAARARGRLERRARARARAGAGRGAGARGRGLVAGRALERMAHDLVPARDVLYIGRGTGFAIALEGALKLKEISYIHAEGYAAGELKHGPIALIDEGVPVIVVAPPDGAVRQDREQPAGGGRAQRQGHPAQRPARLCAPRRLVHTGGGPARGRPVRRADALRHSRAVARLPHGGAERH